MVQAGQALMRSIPKEYISKSDNANYIELDCPHYVHDYKYEEISNEMKKFIMAN